MTNISLKEAKQNLEKLIAQVIADAEPIVLSTEAGEEVVLLPMAEFSSWKETSYLLTNPANAAHLRKSISESSTGQVHENELIDI
jgi:antitoxin YefM